MYLVKFTSAYKKSYKLMRKRGFDVSLLDEVVETLCRGLHLSLGIATMDYQDVFKDFGNVM